MTAPARSPYSESPDDFAGALGGDPPAVTELKTRITELTEDNARLRADNAEQRALTSYYAHIINELSTELEHATATRDQVLANVRPITTAFSSATRLNPTEEERHASRPRPRSDHTTA